jgi:type VI secretion system secreted protein Hcp
MRRLKTQLAAIIAACLLAVLMAVPAEAVTTAEVQSTLKYDVYLNLDGIPGDSTVRNYAKWIILSSVQFDVANTSSSANGGGGEGKAILNNFVITKRFDASSIPLFLAVSSGTHIKKGQLVFVISAKSPLPVMTFDLGSVTLSDYSFNDSYETISLKCSSILMSYAQQKQDGSLGTPTTGGWDFIKNSKL